MNKIKLTTEQIDAIFKKENAKFKKLTKPQKRVAIAKDVLEQIKAELLIPDAGIYFSVCKAGKFSNEIGKELAPLLYTEQCNACALGSIFISQVRKEDKFIINNKSGAYEDGIRTKLRNCFSQLQIGTIETAYMEDDFFTCEDICPSDILMSRCESYRNRNNVVGGRDDTRALKLIMNNIIDNNGTFKP